MQSWQPCPLLAQVVLYVTQGVKGVASIMTLTGATVIVNVLAPPDQLGSVVGAAQTLLNLVRALGPAFAGQMWASTVSIQLPGHQFWPFVILSSGALCTSLLYSPQVIRVPPLIERC